MIYNLKDACEFCAAEIDGGREPTDSRCIERINEAEMILIPEIDTLDMRRVMRVFVDAGKTFPLPEMCESVINVNFNGIAGSVRGMGYEFLDSGPGPELDHAGRSSHLDLRDLGDQWPTFYPVGVTPHRIIAISDHKRDYGTKIRIRGWDVQNREISPANPGEELRIGQWQNGVEGVLDFTTLMLTETAYQEVTSVIKPETYGHVSLYGYNPDTHAMIFLSRYNPHETQPGYRRYEILSKACNEETYIHALVKLRHVKLRNDSDPLLIQNLMALRYMCQSLHEQKQRNITDAMNFQAQAIRSLSKQSEDKSTDASILDFDVSMGMGSIPGI